MAGSKVGSSPSLPPPVTALATGDPAVLLSFSAHAQEHMVPSMISDEDVPHDPALAKWRIRRARSCGICRSTKLIRAVDKPTDIVVANCKSLPVERNVGTTGRNLVAISGVADN
jgi:hypothetical protein